MFISTIFKIVLYFSQEIEPLLEKVGYGPAWTIRQKYNGSFFGIA